MCKMAAGIAGDWNTRPGFASRGHILSRMEPDQCLCLSLRGCRAVGKDATVAMLPQSGYEEQLDCGSGESWPVHYDVGRELKVSSQRWWTRRVSVWSPVLGATRTSQHLQQG